jgi:hypothetical protein
MVKQQKRVSWNTCGKHSAAEHENQKSLTFVHCQFSKLHFPKMTKKVSQNTCAECTAAEQANCSPTFVTYWSICKINFVFVNHKHLAELTQIHLNLAKPVTYKCLCIT